MGKVNIIRKRPTRQRSTPAINRLVASGLLLGLLSGMSLLLPGTAVMAASSSVLSDAGPATMDIDILPGNADNTIDLGKQRLLPVAILGSANFDINDFNPRTLKLKAVGQNLVGKSDKTLCRQQDLNGDSYMDLVCDIKTIGFRVEPGDIKVIISAGTYQRLSLRAEGVIRYIVE
jgi:hypothetical protein